MLNIGLILKRKSQVFIMTVSVYSLSIIKYNQTSLWYQFFGLNPTCACICLFIKKRKEKGRDTILVTFLAKTTKYV